MRYYITLLLLTVVVGWASAQSPLFYAYGNMPSRTVVSPGTYDITITGFVGGYKQYPEANYENSEIAAGYAIWPSGSCTRLEVTQVISTTPLVLRVFDATLSGALDGTDLLNARVLILQESTVGTFKIGAFGNVADGNSGSQSGIGPSDFSCIENYYKTQTAAAIQSHPPVTLGDGSTNLTLSGQQLTLQNNNVSAPLSGNGTIESPLGLQPLGVTSEFIAIGGVTTVEILDGTVQSADIATGLIPPPVNLTGSGIANISGTYPDLTVSVTEAQTATNVPATATAPLTGTTVQAQLNELAGQTHSPVTVTDNSRIDFTLSGQNVSADLAQNGASSGQVMKWNGSAWAPSNDNVGSVTTNNLQGTARTSVTNGTGAILGSSPVTVDVNESGLNPANIPATPTAPLTGTNVQSQLNQLAGQTHVPVTVTDNAKVDFTLSGQNVTATVIESALVAANIPLADAGGLITTDNIESAIQQLATTSHAAVTVTDGTKIDFTLTGQNLTATIIPGTIANTDLAASGATNGQVLKFNGTNWVPSTDNAGTGTVTSVGITPPAAGIGVSGSPVTTNGNISLSLTNDLLALEGLGSIGFPTRTGTDTWAQRSITGTTISSGPGFSMVVTNGDGVAANPSLALSSADFTFHQFCRAVSTTNITLSGLQTIDGVSVLSNDRVLVNGQSTASANGLYLAASGAWTRTTDALNNSNFNNGQVVLVTEGTTNANTVWALSTDSPITVGTTSVSYSNTSPKVSLTGGGINSISGTFPNFTITATEVQTAATVAATPTAPLTGTTVQAELNELAAQTHAPVTVTDNGKIDFTLSGQNVTATVIESALVPANIPVTDAGGFFTTDNIEAALQQLGASSASPSVNVTARLTGNGTSGSPLDIAQQSALTNQALLWNGTTWAPGNTVSIGAFSNSSNSQGLAQTSNQISLRAASNVAPGGVNLQDQILGNGTKTVNKDGAASITTGLVVTNFTAAADDGGSQLALSTLDGDNAYFSNVIVGGSRAGGTETRLSNFAGATLGSTRFLTANNRNVTLNGAYVNSLVNVGSSITLSNANKENLVIFNTAAGALTLPDPASTSFQIGTEIKWENNLTTGAACTVNSSRVATTNEFMVAGGTKVTSLSINVGTSGLFRLCNIDGTTPYWRLIVFN